MSRKREKQRENRRELGRQLDVDPDDAVVDDLVARPRVTEPALTAKLAIESKRGLLERARPLALHLALYVVDGAGARLARLFLYRAPATRSGAVALTQASARGDDRVRYARPARFLLVALVVEGGEHALETEVQTALADVNAVRVVVDAPVTLAVAAKHRALDAVRPVLLAKAAGGPLVDAAMTHAAAAAISIAAVHRVQTTVSMPLVSAYAKYRAALDVDVRL